ncbi:MAG: histone deacetylase family protein [Nanoarchaeota archaeon]|nr:histone deacetylase family protein [Nanoarchaeota archaeon]
MFRIRKIFDGILPANKTAIGKVQEILRSRFPNLKEKDIQKIPEQIKNPLKYKFRSILFVADTKKTDVEGFALLLYASDLNFCYLEFVATIKNISRSGIGNALYQRVREEAQNLGAIGIFYECLPDDKKLCKDPKILAENRLRLKFYERYGVTPIINTKYETPVKDGDDNPPYLLFDGLIKSKTLSSIDAKNMVRAILVRKYSHLVSKEYIDMVVDSFVDDPVLFREKKYIKKEIPTLQEDIHQSKKITLIVNESHILHHIPERGYVESPVRIKSIQKELEKTDIFVKSPAKVFSEKHIQKIHDKNYIEYFKKICSTLDSKKSVYPYVFPIRNATKPPKELEVRAGYYCIDTFTPLNKNAYLAAKGAVDCALSGAQKILEGKKLVYSLVRPPGHHAERKSFGGFCYFNSNAIAADYLSEFGKVAILDIDYHHGNGQQDIFYQRSDVLTISIHGHPKFAYPYFSGFKDEIGVGEGINLNHNFPLDEKIDSEKYRQTLELALSKIKQFKPKFLVVALGLDTAKGDPTGTWDLNFEDFKKNGFLIGSLDIPILVVQEGGYNNQVLGKNAKNFFLGLHKAKYPKD